MASQRPPPYRLTLLGPWDLRGPDGEKVRSVLSQPKRLCLLAYLALRAEAVSRSTLVSLFWPESDEERARNALSQALHYLRRSLGPDVVESVEGDRIRVAADTVWFDARVLLEGATSDGAAARDIASVAEPVLRGREFFQGWNAEDSQPLQEWLDGVRRRVRVRGEEMSGGQGADAHTKVGQARPEAAAPEGGAVAVDGSGAEEVDGRRKPHAAARTGHTSERRRAGGGPAGRRRAITRVGWTTGGLIVGALLAVGIVQGLATGSGETSPEPPMVDPAAVGRTITPAVAILNPRVTVLGDGADLSAPAFAAAVHEELVARIGAWADARVVSVGFESEVWELLRSLEAQGSDRIPEWVLSIGIRSGGGQTRVVALLHRAPDYTSTVAVSAEDYPLPDAAEGLVQLPQEIAADVAQGVAEVVGAARER